MTRCAAVSGALDSTTARSGAVLAIVAHACAGDLERRAGGAAGGRP